jgi:uncharacterized repeat protein (TIGR01451 family)
MNVRALFVFLGMLSVALPAKAQGPHVDSFSPTYQSYLEGTYINIYGSGFSPNGLSVWFTVDRTNAVAAVNPYFVNSTQIQVLVPPNAYFGTGPLYVYCNGLGTWSDAEFTVVGPWPYVHTFSPTNGTGGSQGTRVTITGLHFAAIYQPEPTVHFNGVAGTINFRNSTTITATPPANVTSGPITVYSYSGSFITSALFYAPPSITSYSPFRGRTGTNVMIRGLNFTNATSVRFGGFSATYWVTNNTTIGALVPVGAVTGQIRVDTPNGNPAIVTASNFIVEPTVFGFTPGFGAPGASITVTGANFNVGTPSVKFGGVSAAPPTSVTFGSLNAVVPAGVTNAPITVITTDGSNTSAQLFYAPPRILAFTPTNGAPGTTVQITGTNLIGASSVTFFGTAPIPVSNTTNNTKMTATVPAGVITGPISVTTPAGTTNSGTLYFYGAPVIDSYSPTHGPVDTLVKLTGTNFLGASAVSFNSQNASFWITNSGIIGARVPASATTGPIQVVGPAGTATAAGSFTVDYYSDTAVSMTRSPNPVFVGSNLVYTITVTNKGPNAAPNVRLTNSSPAVVTNLGTITSGGKTVVTLTAVPQTTGTIGNTASVGSDNLDSDPANNSASVTTTVWPFPVLAITPLAGNQFQLSWAAPLSNFTLQFTTNLALTNAWSSITSKPAISGDQSILIQTNTGTNTFFRLRN